ncbi:unnamed protein product [Tilletia controversa]|nr:unnamed protein product [Tilletia controversa]
MAPKKGEPKKGEKPTPARKQAGRRSTAASAQATAPGAGSSAAPVGGSAGAPSGAPSSATVGAAVGAHGPSAPTPSGAPSSAPSAASPAAPTAAPTPLGAPGATSAAGPTGARPTGAGPTGAGPTGAAPTGAGPTGGLAATPNRNAAAAATANANAVAQAAQQRLNQVMWANLTKALEDKGKEISESTTAKIDQALRHYHDSAESFRTTHEVCADVLEVTPSQAVNNKFILVLNEVQLDELQEAMRAYRKADEVSSQLEMEFRQLQKDFAQLKTSTRARTESSSSSLTSSNDDEDPEAALVRAATSGGSKKRKRPRRKRAKFAADHPELVIAVKKNKPPYKPSPGAIAENADAFGTPIANLALPVAAGDSGGDGAENSGGPSNATATGNGAGGSSSGNNGVDVMMGT